MGDSVGVGDFKSAGLEIFAKIEFGSTDEECAFGIDDDIDFAGADENIAVGRTIDEIHLVLQPGASAADDSDAEGAVWAFLPGQQTAQARAGALGDFDQFFVADFKVDRGFHKVR